MEQLYFKKPKGVRVRYAPSPTGPLHIGGARTALFNFLFARKFNGSFILRIEDTDPQRSKKKWEREILESLKWLEIIWDEGPTLKGGEIGNYGPYRQSERKEIYKKYLQRLYQEGYLYWCYCTKEELEAQRKEQISRGEPPHYSNKCRSLSPSEIEKFEKEKRKKVLRFKIPSKIVSFKDEIRGRIEVDTSFWGDIVVAKNFEEPLYNLACVIDDFEMKITHVIRGEDHLSNTPKQILLQEAFGFPKPKYIHLPLILALDRKKLSKRHGAISIKEYRNQGYLPEAIVNLIAFLGWNPGKEREIYSMEDLIKEFSLEKIQKGGAIFNIKKLDFLNGYYIRRRPIQDLTEICIPYLIESGLISQKKEDLKYKIVETGEEITQNLLQKIVGLYQERLRKLSEISDLCDFFFKKKLSYPKDLLRWKEMNDKEIKKALTILEKKLEKIEKEKFNKENLEKMLIVEAEKFSKEIKKEDRGYLLWPLRVSLTGKKASAGPFEIAEILGKEKTILRIKEAKKILEKS